MKYLQKSHYAAAILLSAIFLTFLIAPIPEAQAANCYSGGLGSRSFGVRYVNVNSQWTGGFDTARSRWNSSGAGASIQSQATAIPIMTAGQYTDSWYGLYTPIQNAGGKTFKIQVNARTLSQSAPSNQYWNWVLSTSTHELGHGLRHLDNPLSANPNGSLMNHNRNRNTVGSPTSYDVSYVRSCY